MRLKGAILLAVVALIAIALPAGATNVSISSATADLSFSNDYGAVSQGSTLTISLDLPFTLSQINSTGGSDYLNITADATTASTTVNVTVNGVAVLTNYVIAGGTTKQITFADMASAGVDMSATSLTIAVEAIANSTTSTLLVMSANDAQVSANWSYSVVEQRLSTPQIVKYGEDISFYTVKDTVTVTQNSDVNLTDFKASFTYPSNAISNDVSSYNFGTLNTSESKSVALSYQKRGPAVSVITTNETSTEVNVTMTIYSPEAVSADFTIDPQSETWSRYFPEFNINNLEEIKLNGKAVSYSTSGGDISMFLDLQSGNNELVIVYAKEISAVAQVTATPTPQWYEQKENQLLIAIAVAIIVMAVVLARR